MKKIQQDLYRYIQQNQGCDYVQVFSHLERLLFSKAEITRELALSFDSKFIYFNLETKRYYYADNKNFFIGRFFTNRKNEAFVKEWLFRTDILCDVNPLFIGDAITKDLVLYSLDETGKGIIQAIVKRINPINIGLCILRDNNYIFLSDSMKLKVPIYLENITENLHNYKVIVKDLQKDSSGDFYTAEVEKVLGYKYDPNIDVKLATARFNLLHQFSQEQINIAKQYVFENDVENKLRKDLTNLHFITIDGEDAKDLDDSIYVKKHNDHYQLIVSIADVAHYVKEGDLLDKEAFVRGNSIYLLNTVIPMLPRELSNDLCSLNPNTRKLTLSCDIKFDFEGKLIGYEVYESIIHSKQRLTYTQLNDYFLTKKESGIDNIPMIDDAIFLYRKIAKQFKHNGYLDFDLPDVKILLNDKNYPIDILLLDSNEAQKLIEYFMLSANYCIANFLTTNNLPGIFRVHGKPVESKFFDALNVIKFFKTNLKSIDEGTIITPKYMQYLLNTFKDNENSTSVEKEENYIALNLILRSLDRAKYSSQNKGHFAISIDEYCHFTSPIRRYADLHVHRCIKNFLNRKRYKNNIIINDVNIICSELNIKEFLTQKCEIYLQKLKKAQYLQNYLNKSFTGIISNLQWNGFSVVLPNTIEGFVNLRFLRDDFYEFDIKRSIITGRNTKRVFKFGQKIDIKIKYVNLHNGNIDFSI